MNQQPIIYFTGGGKGQMMDESRLNSVIRYAAEIK
jgi:hypothetical protein